ncbi:glycosyl hydrolase [uncultured Friedmanniella sp.]|uniref:glycosyl hydrolase n=1 Tax=uncultured Friedmanniella sp. TaxID=335381 RepID=UPI0035CB64C3
MTARRRAGLRRPVLELAVAFAVALGAVGCSSQPGPTPGGSTSAPTGSSGAVLPADQVRPLVDGVAHRTVKPLATTRLAAGLVPPTNRWFSGLVFGDQPQPVFPLPLSFGLSASGYQLGLPRVTATAKTVTGGFQPDLAVDAGAASSRVSAYDTATVTLDQLDGGGTTISRTVLAEGSPFVSTTAVRAGSLTVPLAFTRSGEVWTATVGPTHYGLVVHGGSSVASSGATTTVTLPKDATATWFAVPDGGSAEALGALASPVTGSALSYRVGTDQVSTTVSYRSAGDTAVAILPHQKRGLAAGTSCDLGTYASIYGTMTLCTVTDLTWDSPTTTAPSQLDLTGLRDDERAELRDQVTSDVKATPAFPADTYYGGKALYRAAMLYQLARQVGADQAAADIRSRLTTTMAQWTDPQGCTTRSSFCFVYDEAAHGLVGLTPSFGSDEFNDHHFHYGYFLYTAGVLAADDPDLAQKYAPVMNLLAADLASAGGNGLFPDQRVFDAYAGHSWASGTAPFADGNNQESSSEAVTAWTGLSLWAAASGNEALRTEATWLASAEAESATTYWTDVDRADPALKGYGHQIVSLNWGGKRDYGTWFSAEPAAILGIQLIPMSPAAGYLAGDPKQIDANVAEATGGADATGGRFDQHFGDYLLMYSALAGESQRTAALAKARTLDSQWIDDGDSRSYLLAWLMSARS